MRSGKDRIWFALDVASLDEADVLVSQVAPHVGGVKVGLELLTSVGVPTAVAFVQDRGGRVFLDLKLKDIPRTVAGAVKAAAKLKVHMLNLHCTGGRAMMTDAVKAARQVADETGHRTLVYGVTILTSLKDEDHADMGYVEREELGRYQNGYVTHLVTSLARLGQDCGLDGAICSPLEAASVRQACGCDFGITTPGITPLFASKEPDQSRVATPTKAIQNGADDMVVGSAIAKAKDRAEAARLIAAEIEQALSS